MESMFIPPHGRRNPYDDVFLSTRPKREILEAHEYAEIFSGSSSIPVLDISGLVGPGVSRASELDYSNIFSGSLRGELFNSSAEKAKQPYERVVLQESDSLHLQAVSGFTHFDDGTPCLLKEDNGRTVDSLKRKVTRTWSFKEEAEAIKNKSQMPDNKLQSSASHFVPKNDALEKNADEFTSPYNGEDIDDNPIAAALKRAIDQAQESIRLAKIIMDRKKEDCQNGSKARQKGHLKVSYREGEDKSAELNSTIFKDGKSTPSLIYDNAYISAAKIELEIGKGEDEQNLPGEVEQNEVEEKHMNTFECEVPDTIETDEKHCAQIQKGAAFFVSDENCNSCQNEYDAYVERINEAVDVKSSSSSTIFSETREACNVDLDNNPKEYQTVVENQEENYTAPKVIESFSESGISSEEIFVESKHHSDIDSLSCAGSKIENVNVMDADPEEKLSEDEGASSTGEVDDVAQDFDTEDVEQVSEDASGSDEGSVSTSNHEIINGFSAYDSEECKENANELQDEVDLVSHESEGAGGRDSNTENNKGNFAGTSLLKEKDVKVGNPQNNDKNDYQQRIDAIKRGREREKERKVVERAIREARERAFAEAWERAERASLEKSSTEPRQRSMSEAREKVSRVDRAYTWAKFRAEHAAVEKATAKARERAMEKAMSLKTTHTVQRTAEKVSGSSRDNGLKHSSSSSDLDNGTESAQRHRARLERHQMIMERAEKALTEKNVRDVLAQKEQAERNILAESLDGDIRRWATGKEKNLIALLSTLQHILGSDRWQPIPLTDMVTAAAVKKAYRKATLCVHPDKLQQRGATIKQRYICEKVFDLLKVAWNSYDSDER